MSLLFLLPFGTGSIYSIRKKMNKPVGWGLPISLITTTSIMQTFRSYKNLEELTVKDVKRFPLSFAAAAIWQGSFFCAGHLFTKMTYPILEDK